MNASAFEESSFTEDDLREMVLRLAHEIRNPLATIQSAVQLLEHLQKPQAETLEFYEGIYVEVSRINKVVRDMQRFARLNVNTATSISVADAVAVAVEAAINRMNRKGENVQIQKTCPAIVVMDREQLETAIAELVENALSFSPLHAEIVVNSELLNEDYVLIAVADRGPGIPEETCDRIIRPFFSSSTHGTGLGLNIVAKTCQLAGGELRWRNRLHGGAVFEMTLPVIVGS